MKCKYCGKPLDPDKPFCKYCGERRQAQLPEGKPTKPAAPPSLADQMPRWILPAAAIAAAALLITCVIAIVQRSRTSAPAIAETPDETVALTNATVEETEPETFPETETETEPTEAPFSTDVAWIQAYHDSILTFEEDHPDVNPDRNIKYRLLYIDDNEIPELLMQAGDSTALYTVSVDEGDADDPDDDTAETTRIYSSASSQTEKFLGVRTRCGTFLTSRLTDGGERYAVNSLQNGKVTEVESYRSEGETYTVNGEAADLVSFTQYVRAKQASYQLTDLPVYHKSDLFAAMERAATGDDIPEPASEVELPELTTVNPTSATDTTDAADTETGEKHFTVVAGNMTWSQAQAAAKAKGGHLAYIKNAEDFAAVKKAIGDTELKYLWVGGKTSIGSDGTVTAKWADGSSTSYLDSAGLWFGHEPSGKDGDILEPYMMLWNVDGWSFNDNSDACVDIYAAGSMGYILETHE